MIVPNTDKQSKSHIREIMRFPQNSVKGVWVVLPLQQRSERFLGAGKGAAGSGLQILVRYAIVAVPPLEFVLRAPCVI
jgi:hypothetical protein